MAMKKAFGVARLLSYLAHEFSSANFKASDTVISVLTRPTMKCMKSVPTLATTVWTSAEQRCNRFRVPAILHECVKSVLPVGCQKVFTMCRELGTDGCWQRIHPHRRKRWAHDSEHFRGQHWICTTEYTKLCRRLAGRVYADTPNRHGE